nr:hypothetical protein BaRGS_034230 [Batillaria attramentaria]
MAIIIIAVYTFCLFGTGFGSFKYYPQAYIDPVTNATRYRIALTDFYVNNRRFVNTVFEIICNATIQTVSLVVVIEEHHGHVYELLFKAIDDNNDGHITKAEFDAHASDLDVDGNGEVTEQEFTQVWGSVTQHPGYMNIHAAELLFESVDGGTGAISLSNIDVLYAAFDTDGNGDVGLEEFLEEWHKVGFLCNTLNVILK